jgi:succinate dehydrogenase / fumarate reductase cytochrome b subunit
MTNIFRFYQSTVGKKVVVAVTGLLMALFLIGHMAGNLKAYAGVGADGIHKLDHYAYFLRTILSDVMGYGNFLWASRIGLLAALILHLVTIIQLQTRNSKARPVEYAKFKHQASSLAAKTMLIGGIFILFFIVFHLLHLTFGTVGDFGFVHGHVYANVYNSFKQPIFLVIYAIAMVIVGLHLFHGLWSMTQTLGLDSPDKNKMYKNLAKLLAFVIALGFISVPLGVATGILSEPPQKFLEEL